jgi:hypothetical protein
MVRMESGLKRLICWAFKLKAKKMRKVKAIRIFLFIVDSSWFMVEKRGRITIK